MNEEIKSVDLEVDNEDGIVGDTAEEMMDDVYAKMISIAKNKQLPVPDTIDMTPKPTKRRRKSPNTKPSTYEVGHVELSENDGNYYVVVKNRNNVRPYVNKTYTNY